MTHEHDHSKKLGVFTATCFVIANMIGTGVFTSLGFQVAEIPSIFPLLMLWVIGGVIALCGALSYSELGAALPRSGGEYHLLSRIYHPALGFLSGWVSLTVGFAAPTALAAMALVSYLNAAVADPPARHLAAAIVVMFTIIHGVSIRVGSRVHNFFTTLKVTLILIFIAAAFWIEPAQATSLLPRSGDGRLFTTSAFAVSLVFVSFAYSGWNAAIYVVGEIRQPQKNLPRALFAGTLVVTVLYVLLNYVFLFTVPLAELAGKIEIAYLSGNRVFGPAGGKIMALTLAFLLLSTVSGHVFVGPRITQVMGEDYPVLRLLKTKSRRGIPVNAMMFQLGVVLLLIYTSTFEQVMIYAGFVLNLITTLAVAGVFVLRIQKPELPRPYRAWGYPVTPAIFLLVSGWTLAYVMMARPLESLSGLGIVLLGLGVYFISERMAQRSQLNGVLE
jgi:APA family basic amino acid/polyamine antiporter